MLQSRTKRECQDNYSKLHIHFKLVIVSFMILLAFENVLAPAVAEESNGFYVDNGIDQTVAQKMTMHTIKREIASELLNVLKLPDRPRRIARKATMVKRSAPKFLLNIYTTLPYDLKYGQTNPRGMEEFNLTNQDISAIDRSDVIMTFGAYNPHMSHEPKNNRGRRIWFDVSEVPVGERILAAELRLYRMLLNDSINDNTSYTISVYRVSRTSSGERKKHYMDSINVGAKQEGWIKLNITEALQSWVSNSEENKGLFIAAYHSDLFKRVMRPDDIGIVGVAGIPDKEPFMVSYFEHSGAYKSIIRQKRSAWKKEQKYTSLDIRKNFYVAAPATRKNTDICNVRTLYVSFKDLQWQDWVIAPEGFEANYCKGHCTFPLKTNATNHAILQTLVHLLKPEAGIPTPCCAPTKLSPMSVLYFLDHSNVVLKKYKNMIVDSCGCH